MLEMNQIESMYEEDFVKDFNRWRTRLRRTTVVAMVQMFFQGLENFSIVTSLMYYLKEMKVQNTPYWYSIVMTSITFAEAIGCAILPRFADKYRNMRVMMIVCLILSTVGNIMYTLHYNIWLLVIGRFICGFGRAMNSIASGEFRRCYTDETELSRVLSIYQYVFNIGYILGPCTGVLVLKINFKWYTWYVDRYNSIGLLLAIFSLLILLAAVVFCSDISKEYDLLMARKTNLLLHNIVDTRNKENSEEETSNKVKRREMTFKLWTWRNLMKQKFLLILLSCGMIRYACNLTEAIRVYIATTIFQWDINDIGITMSICLLLSQAVIAIFIYQNLFQGKSSNFFFFVLSLCTAAIAVCLLVLPTVINVKLFAWQVAFFFTDGVLECFLTYFGYVAGRNVMLDMTPAHSACFVDGFRVSFSTVFKILSLLSSGVIFTHNFLFLPIVFILLLLANSTLYKKDAFL